MLIDLAQLIRKYNLQIEGIIHVGAHMGQEYEMYNKLGITEIVWFEPVKETYQKLIYNLPKSSLTYNVALGDEVGEKEMFIETVNGGQSSSILEPGTHLETYPNITFDTRQIVQMQRLDNYKFSVYNMLNMDVQGYELEVLKGSENTLNHIDIIYTEINTEDVYKGCVHVDQLDEFLDLHEFERVFTQMACKSWGDALYIKRKNYGSN
jgi:FkbM family methyltransferase